MTDQWTVAVNAEEQHGLYPAELELPGGWAPAGFTGSERDCMSWVDEHWTDLRPLSLRRVGGG